ncbi:UV DNA damage repair endonuclease UvsE [Bacillus massiliigorillae]|uniref:UV DNA damage repair endonuclease UvsE n=1 Tax=Bacillus massiliigorillae TaxID=1243664 RepID=UPI00039DC732|nr:UV DNA damage repair endonuclease UvsE [Bacillus massiliigorillae]
MTVFRFGYVAMSVHVKNASPSKTMTYTQFSKLADREAAIRKLERIAQNNLHNCLRLLRHNVAHHISFFRLSSKLIPLANHPELLDWDYIKPLRTSLAELKEFIKTYPDLRIDFHPDHFVLLNTKDKDVFSVSIKTLQMHYMLLKGMGIAIDHRCVMHVGGSYQDKELALEQFIHNWALVPHHIQRMVMLENDDTTFTWSDTLYVCEKLGIPLVFDYHHHLANREEGNDFQVNWQRTIATWQQSKLPLKMHISSPKSNKEFRAHADLIDLDMFWEFVSAVQGTVPQIDVMIEAKLKDEALFQLMKDIRLSKNVRWLNEASFELC